MSKLSVGRYNGLPVISTYDLCCFKSKENLSTDTLGTTELNWTESIASLTELVYAIYSTGALNNGKAETGETALAYEAVFNVDFNNYCWSYMEIKIRKNNRTKFLDQLKEKLTKKMGEDDLK